LKRLIFRSKEPIVRLTKYFPNSFRNAIAAARTCYSASGIVDDGKITEADYRIAETVYQAGHHTVYQHGYFQFALENVSRQFIWSFLHSHPFYNSEQVSQRYVKIKKDGFLTPPLASDALTIYERTIRQQTDCYRRLSDLLKPDVERAYFDRFPARQKNREAYGLDITRKAREVARYVMPVATFAYLYHTISGLTLMRYYRLCQQADVPTEQRLVVGKMVDELRRIDPDYERILEEPIPQMQTPEYRFFQTLDQKNPLSLGFIREFDADLGDLSSKLVDWKIRQESVLASSIREVMGLPKSAISDHFAIELVMNPGKNPLFGESLNMTMHDKLTRTLNHVSYSFRRKLSHTADSQDQRHRTTPASRPILHRHISEGPDYITPPLIEQNPKALRLYQETMEKTWDSINRLREMGTREEFALYLLPNAVSVRYTQSADLLSLRHKYAMRICYNAQEEIWRLSLEEIRQIREINPLIGSYLIPPCGLRQLSDIRPFCPEGERFCGERVWTYPLDRFRRFI